MKKLRLILTAMVAVVIAAVIAFSAMKLSDNASPALLRLAADHLPLLQTFILLLILMSVVLLLGGRHRGQ